MKAVLTTPEASPDSLGSTSLIAAISTGFIAIPTPIPRMIIAGSTSSQKFPSTGARANSSSPSETSAIPTPIGSRVPKRITIRAESPSEKAPMMMFAGRKASPTCSGS